MRHLEVKKEMGADARAGESKEQGIPKVSWDTSIVLLINKLLKDRGRLDFSLPWSFQYLTHSKESVSDYFLNP